MCECPVHIKFLSDSHHEKGLIKSCLEKNLEKYGMDKINFGVLHKKCSIFCERLQSLPTRERGLKFRKMTLLLWVDFVAPYEGRGLKFLFVVAFVSQPSRSPRGNMDEKDIL